LSEGAEAAGGLGLLVTTFLPWYSAGGEHLTAWQAFSVTDFFLAAAVIAALSVAAAVLFRISVSYPIAGSTVSALFGGIALLLIVIRLLNPPGGGGVGIEYGAWLGLISAAAITLGAYVAMQEPTAHRAAANSAG
jgi:poly(3-hydroxybutyrate) depolymerase